jgi:hypothetical protein
MTGLQKKNTTSSPTLLGLFIVFGVSLGVTFWLFIIPFIDLMRAKSWIKTECEIIDSSITLKHGVRGRSYRDIDILYSYFYKGQIHLSDKYGFFLFLGHYCPECGSRQLEL